MKLKEIARGCGEGPPPPPQGGGNPETQGNVKKSIGTMKSEGAELSPSPHSVFERTRPPAPEKKEKSGFRTPQRDGRGGGGLSRPDAKKVGGGGGG